MDLCFLKAKRGANISYSVFSGVDTDEFHLMVEPEPLGSVCDQIGQVLESALDFLQSKGMDRHNILFHRYFASDIANSFESIRAAVQATFESPASIIQQPTTAGNKVAAWIYAVKFNAGTVRTHNNKNTLSIEHNGYQHLFASQLSAADACNSKLQTIQLFGKYNEILQNKDLTLAEHCIRTWLFVRDIDNNYQGMVEARNEIFAREGLTTDSHFIASTGIEGETHQAQTLVAMDAYAVGGIDSKQITHLKALDHLSATADYGVAFERATAVDYGDRRHIFVSGTASIDRKGQILHEQDIEKQTERTFENIAALLHEGQASLNDLASILVYIRDWADHRFVANYLQTHFPKVPALCVWAPVCRQGWLIEVEGIAIKKMEQNQFRNF